MTPGTLFKQLNIVPFGAAVLEKKIFEAFPNISICKNLSPWGGAIYITLGTSFEQTSVSWS